MPAKNIRFDYFRVYQRDEETGEEAVFDLLNLINQVNHLRETNRAGLQAQTTSGVIRLMHCEIVDPTDTYYALNFVKHKTLVVPGIASLADDDIRDLDLDEGEFITEDLNILYHSTVHILMMQKNRQVASPKVFAEYIKRVLNVNGLTFELRPLVPATNNFRRMNAAREVNRMTVKLEMRPLLEEHPERENALGVHLREILAGFEADSVELVLKRRRGNGGLNRQRIAENAVGVMDQFSKYSVDIIQDEGPDVIDFLQENLHDMITFNLEVGQRLYSEYAITEMQRRFAEKIGALQRAIRNGGRQ